MCGDVKVFRTGARDACGARPRPGAILLRPAITVQGLSHAPGHTPETPTCRPVSSPSRPCECAPHDRSVTIAPVLDGGEYSSGKVPVHDLWLLLLAEPSTPRGNLTVRQRAVLRDLLVPKDDLLRAAANLTDPTDTSPCEWPWRMAC